MQLLKATLPTQRLRRTLGHWRDEFMLPQAARAERRRDAGGLPADDPGIDAVLAAGTAWLKAAQDHSKSQDGGAARHWSFIDGWGASYPETTGYIIPTLLAAAALYGDDDLTARARRMADWCVRIQLPSGGFQGGRIDATPVVPVTFNTGQILLGLCAAETAFGGYSTPTQRAADWLAGTLDEDGCWRKHGSPFTAPGEKAYETHVAWGLFEAERLFPGRGYGAAGLRQVDWALCKQQPNGWLADCCLTYPDRPLTHTLGYALRGILEAYRLAGTERYLGAARRLADGLAGVLDDAGFLAGRWDRDWRATVPWCCLTGSVQIAYCWFELFAITGAAHYRAAALRANRYVRRSVDVAGPPARRGGVKGAFPVDGDYGRYEYLNWAVKFMLDANLRERALSA